MGQANGKRDIEEGLRLFKACKEEKANKLWKQTLDRTKDRNIRFIMIRHIISALFGMGRYRDCATLAIEQLTSANMLDRKDYKAEAYWNLARSNARSGEFQKALSFGKHALSNTSQKDNDGQLLGWIHLALAESHLGFSDFQGALEQAERALRQATGTDNLVLECETYVIYGDVYLTLKDYDKAMKFYIRSSEMIRCLGQPWSPQLRATVLLKLANGNRKQRVLDRALQYCEDAMKLAMEERDYAMQARCLASLGDIHRSRKDVEKAHSKYEASWSQAGEIGDHVCQLYILMGLIKIFMSSREFEKANEAAARGLEVGSGIGSKIHVLRCHWFLYQLYMNSEERTLSQDHAKKFDGLLRELQLYCGVCHDVIGKQKDNVYVMECCHIYHSNQFGHLRHRNTGNPAV
ncbi:putative 43 kDa receptor-associated protein of the synapse isoform X1 [Apostichopus japonicus]|uniref:Putative 43 kDa receptor-associated protein of the synapse isoform X1 n=1 Tax=Stichopus japonicus TaxID=307972 RepID=A0A2G8JUD7_STIJA|nr:putative 43 kDa receptor-associated protein of the synapse isoform X1 [Apostichopus japonicus]